MRYADHAPTLASGANIAAFNLGNALGAWAGGVTIAAGLGYTSPIWVGAAITAAALLVMVVAAVTARRRDRADAPDEHARPTTHAPRHPSPDPTNPHRNIENGTPDEQHPHDRHRRHEPHPEGRHGASDRLLGGRARDRAPRPRRGRPHRDHRDPRRRDPDRRPRKPRPVADRWRGAGPRARRRTSMPSPTTSRAAVPVADDRPRRLRRRRAARRPRPDDRSRLRPERRPRARRRERRRHHHRAVLPRTRRTALGDASPTGRSRSTAAASPSSPTRRSAPAAPARTRRGGSSRALRERGAVIDSAAPWSDHVVDRRQPHHGPEPAVERVRRRGA